jgi:hypothetical protein
MRLKSLPDSTGKPASKTNPSPKLARILVFTVGVALMISGAVPLAKWKTTLSNQYYAIIRLHGKA